MALSPVVRALLLMLSWVLPSQDPVQCLTSWQNSLGLQDWTIELHSASRHDLADGTVGDIDIDASRHKASIRMLRETESRLPSRLARVDQRLTILHELVHLRRFADGEPNWCSEHITNERTAAFVRARHRWQELSLLDH